MKRINTKRLSAVLLLAAVCIAPKSNAQGTVQITFDGPPLQPPGSDYAVTNYYESGMQFMPIPGSYAFGRVFPSYPADPQDGTAYLRAPFTESLMFSFANGSLFGLESVDLAEYSTFYTGQPATVPFVGFHPDGSTVTNTFTTDGIIDGTGPLQDFQTFYFKDFTDVTRVEIRTPLWSLDNLVVSIPEPHIGLLSFAGGLLLWTLPRRKPGLN